MPDTRILIVDDDQSTRFGLVSFLEDRGFEPFEAGDGREALEVFERVKPEVVLADLRMPGMDGLQLLEHLTATSPETPVIMVSGTGAIHDAVKALRIGAWDYVVKPVEDMTIILHAIERALERSRLQRENREYQTRLQAMVEEKSAELEQTNAQLLHAQKMEAIGRLAGGVAHDFNNLLTAIYGNILLAFLDVDPASTVAERLNEIQHCAERAAGLTRQLLAFGRRQVMQPKVLDPNKLVTSMQVMLGRIIGEDVLLEANLCECPCRIRADPGQVEQVIVNIAVNARDAMPDGGKLTMELSCIELDEQFCEMHPSITPGEYVRISMTDSGHGMDAETRRHIFEPFFTTKGEKGGTGLGLSTCYGIVEQHGGVIEVASEPGVRTTFHIYFPRVSQDADSAQVTPTRQIPVGVETILLVEDDAVVRSVAMTFLEGIGYTVIVACDPEEALKLAGQTSNRIDLLFTDVVMPSMNGHELSKRLIASRPDTKVLFMSGYADNPIVREAILDEGVHFLEKPFKLEDLAIKVREVLDAGG